MRPERANTLLASQAWEGIGTFVAGERLGSGGAHNPTSSGATPESATMDRSSSGKDCCLTRSVRRFESSTVHQSDMARNGLTGVPVALSPAGTRIGVMFRSGFLWP